MHSPGGPGWNQTTTGPDSLTTPPQSKNYGGFNEEIFVLYDLIPRVAIAWENDAHQGGFTPKKVSGQPPSTRSFAVTSTDAALRLQIRPLEPETGVWSIVCFLVDRYQRRRGIAATLLAAAVKHAFARGAGAIEAYPHRANATDYMGSVPLYESAGFKRARDANKRAIYRLNAR